jgi:hypothetical protein
MVKISPPLLIKGCPIEPPPGIADPAAWCRAVQERRFAELLMREDAELARDQSEQAQRWRALALRLALGNFPELHVAPPRQPRKPPGRKNHDRKILDAVGDEMVKAKEAGRAIIQEDAFKRAKKNNPWMQKMKWTQFRDAKQRYYKLHPEERPRPGKSRST